VCVTASNTERGIKCVAVLMMVMMMTSKNKNPAFQNFFSKIIDIFGKPCSDGSGRCGGP